MRRNVAIDIFRGLTMALMIFVNNLWTIGEAPAWMEHTPTRADGMGLADFVFPMFLFAVGLSIPLALDRRMEKGAPTADVIRHILGRSFALLVMGVFILNGEHGMMMDEGLYLLVMLAGFFLIWNRYPAGFQGQGWLKVAGAAMLIVLAFLFRSDEGKLFRAGWWGILGMIGWAYLFVSSAYLLCRKKPWILLLLMLGLMLTNLSVMRMRSGEAPIGPNVLADLADALNLGGKGSNAILTLAGTLTVLAGRRIPKRKLLWGLLAAAFLALLGTGAHRFWILSKNLGTPPWYLYSLAVSVALYSLFRFLEGKGWTAWARPLKPVGTATLTAYMVPILFEAIRHFAGFFMDTDAPAWLCGYVGAAKCLLFTVLCIGATWGLVKAGLQLKV